MKSILCFVLCALALPSAFLFAQTPDCGTITKLVYEYDPETQTQNTQLETFPITDCDNPFGRTQEGMGSYSLEIEGTQVTENAVVEVPEGGTRNYAYDFYNGAIYRHEGQNYVYTDTMPSDSGPTESEYRGFAEAFFPAGTNLELYVQAALNDDTSELSEEEEDLYWDFYDYVEEVFVPIKPLLAAGTYTLVITPPTLEGNNTNTWLENLKQLLVPIAYAQYIGEVYTFTFTVVEVEPEPPGASSVLFLPGIQASRLYKDGLFGTEDKLWEPNNPFNDVAQLSMTSTGESEEEIYTRDVVDTAPGIGNVYAGFISFLDGLISQEVINEFYSYAYDWRYDVFDIAENGTQYEDELKKLDVIVNQLASGSKSDKVTIVAHSNGGLLAKALLIEYPELAAKIDRIIFLGSPQLGTPKAVGAVLHGFDQNLGYYGWFMSDRNAREVLINFPGVYGLLPGQSYLNGLDDPVITFDESPETSIFRNAYGNSIDSQEELKKFMLGGEDGRPAASFTNDAELANPNLLSIALDSHRELLDDWIAPNSIEVIEIVGVGLSTVAGFHYQGFNCSRPECRNLRVYKPVPKLSQYGDQTVIASSAEGHDGMKIVKYIDLAEIYRVTKEKIEHANLTESSSVQTVIKDILMNETPEPIPFVSNEPFTYSNQSVLIGVHSPVALTVKDTNGNIVGRAGTTSEGFPNFKEEIVGSSYFELGDSKYAIVPSDVPFEVIMKGEGLGGMTFTVHEISGEEQVQVINIPIATTSSSTSIVVQNNGTAFGNLKVDVNGDGKIEQEITPAGQVIIPSPGESLFEQLQKEVRSLKLEAKYKLPIILAIEAAKALDEKGKGPLAKIAEKTILSELSKLLKQYLSKKLISTTEYKKLVGIIEEINSI